MFTYTKFPYDQLHDLSTKLCIDLRDNHGFIVDHVSDEYAHFHKGNQHWHVDHQFYYGESWTMGTVRGFVDDESISKQPGYIDAIYLSQTFADSDYERVGDAHLFSNASGFILYFSLTNKSTKGKEWFAVLSCTLNNTCGIYDEPVIYTSSSSLFQDTTDKFVPILSQSGYDNTSHLYAKFTGGYNDHVYDCHRSRLIEPEVNAMAPLYTAGSQGGYQFMEKPPIFINEQQGHTQFIGSIDGLYIMNKSGRLPFEEFTLNGKKYISCPSFHAIEIAG